MGKYQRNVLGSQKIFNSARYLIFHPNYFLQKFEPKSDKFDPCGLCLMPNSMYISDVSGDDLGSKFSDAKIWEKGCWMFKVAKIVRF